MSQGELTVAKAKRKTKGKEPMKPKTIGVRATGEWAAWLERAAKHFRIDVAKFLDLAAADYSKRHGFDEPPPERIP